jgi:hypothetical protein
MMRRLYSTVGGTGFNMTRTEVLDLEVAEIHEHIRWLAETVAALKRAQGG